MARLTTTNDITTVTEGGGSLVFTLTLDAAAVSEAIERGYGSD